MESYVTWRDIATQSPEFVEWVVQKYGPRTDGPVDEETYNELAAKFLSRI